jgi:hypothetical protein
MPSDPDPLAAELAGIRERASQITDDHDVADCIADLGGPCSGHDAERLADVVEAVLGRHQPKTVTVREMCAAHGWGTKAGHSVPLGDFRAEVDACPDCVKREQVTCTGCNPECPDDNLWEKCPERAAITSKLLSEGATGG